LVRIFVDEGQPMAGLLSEAAVNGIMPAYPTQLLTAFEAEDRRNKIESDPYRPVGLVAQGLSNNEISERLFLALSTVKGHNLKIFEKQQVQRCTEAADRAGKRGLLQPTKR
jgi:LuxR family transcriptional regulator, maltose regulon positive regulatory protein